MATAAEKKAAAEKAKREKAKAAKFVELAQKRVTKAINSIRSVAKLSNKNNYVYTPEQIETISEALRAEVVAMHELFSKEPGAAKEVFKL